MEDDGFEETFVVCDCHSHALSLFWDGKNEELPLAYVGMWYRGEGYYPLWLRLGWAWDMIRGRSGPGEIVLRREGIQKFITALQRAEKSMERDPNVTLAHFFSEGVRAKRKGEPRVVPGHLVRDGKTEEIGAWTRGWDQG